MPARRRVGLAIAALAAAGAAAAVAMRCAGSPEAGESGAGPVGAQPVVPAGSSVAGAAGSHAADAASLVSAASAAAAAGSYADARSLLQRAYALDRQPSTLMQLATVEHKMGHCREARRAAQGVVAAVPGEPLVSQASALLGELGRCD